MIERTSQTRTDRPDWSSERRRRQRRGRRSEWIAAALLMAKGYRILARRHQTHAGEIDLIARRGRRIAFVEVKQQLTAEAAEAAIGERQRQRLRRASLLWLARHPAYQSHDVGFDLVLIVPGRWPRHIPNGF